MMMRMMMVMMLIGFIRITVYLLSVHPNMIEIQLPVIKLAFRKSPPEQKAPPTKCCCIQSRVTPECTHEGTHECTHEREDE